MNDKCDDRALAGGGAMAPARMDAPDGPVCGCGNPSRHESGWCGVCPLSSPPSDGDTLASLTRERDEARAEAKAAICASVQMQRERDEVREKVTKLSAAIVACERDHAASLRRRSESERDDLDDLIDEVRKNPIAAHAMDRRDWERAGERFRTLVGERWEVRWTVANVGDGISRFFTRAFAAAYARDTRRRPRCQNVRLVHVRGYRVER